MNFAFKNGHKKKMVINLINSVSLIWTQIH